MKYFIILSLSILIFPTLVFAHPGRIDSQGGHYCRTNCENWGFKEGEYHYHNSVAQLVKPAKTQSKINSK